jgi:hypothetical protein
VALAFSRRGHWYPLSRAITIIAIVVVAAAAAAMAE